MRRSLLLVAALLIMAGAPAAASASGGPAPRAVPVVNAGADAAVNEGSLWTQAGTFTDDDPADPWTATVDWDSPSTPVPLALAAKAFTLSHTWADEGDGSFNVRVCVNDGTTAPCDDAVVTVSNVAPVVAAGADVVLGAPGLFTGTVTFTDPGTDTWFASILWGDGTTDSFFPAGRSFGLSHTFAGYGIFPVVVTVSDGDGGTGSDTVVVTVQPGCHGQVPTISGTAGADVLTGTAGNDVIVGLGGNDTIDGLGGNDYICGGDGDDSITGGPGFDYVEGGAGADWALYATAPAGVVVNLTTGIATGGHSLDLLNGIEKAGGSAFADTLIGDGAANTLTGLSGDDRIHGRGGNDILDGGTGSDWVKFQGAPSGITVSLLAGTATGGDGTDAVASFENVSGSAHADTIIGSADANILHGNGGDDSISGGAGDDSIRGGQGNDVLNGGEGSDWVLYQGAPAPVVVDLVAGTAAGGHGTDALSGFEKVAGSARADTLIGDANANVLYGLRGSDRLTGGGGNDLIDGGPGRDWAVYAGAPAAVIVNLAVGTATGGHGSDSVSGIENVEGSAYGDTIIGTTAVNRLKGGNGADRITGAWAADFIDGGPGSDWAVYDGGVGAVTVNLALGRASGAHGADRLTGVENVSGSPYDDTIIGNHLANHLLGQQGDDRITGGGGNDVIEGGPGFDHANGGPGSDTCSTEVTVACE